ncbi:MAG: YraN family protein [Myxococcales bacterium]|nr:YraN family protein [Myxococcales bacterium]
MSARHVEGPDAVQQRALRQAARAELGRRAEVMACKHLETQGFEILARNVRVGRLELDVIARRGRMVVFCEVRSRRSDRLMTPAQSIDGAKVTRVRQAAGRWLRENGQSYREIRFDVASVVFDTPEGRLNYLQGAF